MSFTFVFSLYNVVKQKRMSVNNNVNIKKLCALTFCVPINTINKGDCEDWILLMHQICSFDEDQFFLLLF